MRSPLCTVKIISNSNDKKVAVLLADAAGAITHYFEDFYGDCF